jgi:NADH/NAD ratio-sensing transcriptional regulator Rex
MADKYQCNYNTLLMWVWAHLRNISIGNYIREKGYNSIAIYGMGALGSLLYEELEKDGIKVAFVIDNNKGVFCQCPVYSLEDEIPNVDMVLITVEIQVAEIINQLAKKGIKCISFQHFLCLITRLSL